jgi:mRNA interferase RelE/StbE
MMNISQKTPFKKAYKKLHDNQVPAVNDAINLILNNPSIGEAKKGDLAGLLVYKFDVQNQLYLLAYTVEGEDLTLLALGVHENFYDKLKRQ